MLLFLIILKLLKITTTFHTSNKITKPFISTVLIASTFTKSTIISNMISNKDANSIEATYLSIDDRKRAALFGMFVADATAMPVHWMYDLLQLKSDYGKITGYVKPKDKFEGSIMNLSNTGGGGRGSDKGDIVGDVILHGKKKYWTRGGNNHYHLGLLAGENTLEIQLTRLLMKSLLENNSKFNKDDFLKKYIAFMTTPNTHNDTYASTAHRMFFANYVKGVDPNKCADNDGHNTDAIDALTLTIPIIIAYADAERNERNAKIHELISCTRRSTVLQSYAEKYADILVEVLHGADLRTAIEKFENSKSLLKAAVNPQQSDPMVACYIDSSFPALLFFSYRYADWLEDGILANANAGGENVARGSLLGALLGAQHGLQGFPTWSLELKDKVQINEEIDKFLLNK